MNFLRSASKSPRWRLLVVPSLPIIALLGALIYRLTQNFWTLVDGLLTSLWGAFILVAFIALISICGEAVRRRGMLTFYGLDGNQTKVFIYLSNVYIKPQGTKALVPVVDGYSGAAITNIEYDAALKILYRLEEQTIVVAPKALQEWVSQLLDIKKPDIEIKVSPSANENLELEREGTIISLGSNIYNSVTRHLS